MILRDRLTVRLKGAAGGGPGAVVVENVRCHVGYRRVEGNVADQPTALNRLAAWIEVIVPPGTPWNPEKHEAEWRGMQFTMDGPAAMVMQGGRVHHLTCGLRRITA